jgi:non-specific serine/threonine protein kinase/serine/threonine-protein kinase
VNRDRWARLKELFAAAAELETEARAAFLDRECGGDGELRAELESLLAAGSGAGGFLETPATAEGLLAPEAPSPVGRRIGPYRVVAEIGRGGMGVVYRAVRDDDVFHKEVALKLLAGEAGSAPFEERFRRERQILATLDHPGIARLLDGGADGTGRPFFVLELVDGTPIDRHCRERGLGLRPRLELFRTVCGAVAFAHSRLVVHCDIKPGNVLVADDGTVKLLDFGIAKLLAVEGPGSTPAATATGWWMTPEYASPEQVRGEPVTTATDVYALGVMLYELLTGRTPYDLASRGADEVVRAICEREVTRPSLAATRRLAAGDPRSAPEAGAGPPDGNPRRLGRRLAGDLDTIALRALAKDPRRRYQSVTELSEDVRRHLAGLPIRARPDDVGYRLRKFVGRHRAGVVAAALVVASLAGGLLATARQARIARAERAVAERRFDEVRELARTFIFDVHDEIAGLPGSTPVRERIVALGLDYLERLSREAADDAGLQRELAEAYERIAAVQGGVGQANLGDLEGAIASQRRALELRERVAGAAPEDLAAILTLARAHARLGDLLGGAGDDRGRRDHAAAALAIRRDAALRFPDDPAVRRALASGLWDAAQLRVDSGDLAGGLAGFEEVLGHYRVAAAAPAATDNDRRNLALTLKKIGAVRSASGDQEGALEAIGEALAIDEVRLAADPGRPATMLDVSFDHGDLGYVELQRGRPREAVGHYERAVELRRRVSEADPADARGRDILRTAELRLAGALAAVITGEEPGCPELDTLAGRALELWARAATAGPLDDEAVAARDGVEAALAGCRR